MEVAACDVRKLCLGNPREDLVPVDQLEAVDALTQRPPLDREAGGASIGLSCLRKAVWMSRDEYRSGGRSLGEGTLDSLVDADELT